jgi:hypothetical protein
MNPNEFIAPPLIFVHCSISMIQGTDCRRKIGGRTQVRFLHMRVGDGGIKVKTAKHIAAGTFGILVSLANTTVSATEIRQPVTMRPLMATSLDTGSKHVVSYFVGADGACKLTLMISEKQNDEAEGTTASRLQLMLEPHKSSRLDVADGKSLEFFCGTAALTMIVSPLDRVAMNRGGAK